MSNNKLSKESKHNKERKFNDQENNKEAKKRNRIIKKQVEKHTSKRDNSSLSLDIKRKLYS